MSGQLNTAIEALRAITNSDDMRWLGEYVRERRAYDVAIQWDLPAPSPFADVVIPAGSEPYLHIRTGVPLVDWFTREEYERFLVEVGSAEDTDAQR